MAGPVIWALEDEPEILGRYREFMAAAPRAVNTVVGLRKAPTALFLPARIGVSAFQHPAAVNKGRAKKEGGGAENGGDADR